MALPTINEEASYHQQELPSGKKIGIKPWKVAEEKELLFAVEGIEDLDDSKKEIVKFIKKCVDNTQLFDTLSNTDYVYLIAKLRKLSKGSTIEYTYKCESCSFPLQDTVSIENNLIVKKFNSSSIKVRDDLIITIKEVPFRIYDSLITTYTKVTEYNYNYILNSIETIAYKGQVYEEYTQEELIKFVDSLGSNEFADMVKQINNAGAEIKLEKTIKCGKCKHDNIVEFGDLYYFLAF